MTRLAEQGCARKLAPGPRPARRGMLAMLGGTLLLAGCQNVVPSGPRTVDTPPPPPPKPDRGLVLAEADRHPVAILVPLSGSNAAVGQSLLNAAMLAVADTKAQNIRLTPYDTAKGAEVAARRAVADGNRLILGPLFGDNVVTVAGVAAGARVPVISFSNDIGVAGANIYLMGQLPGQSIGRVVDYSVKQGKTRFAALVPDSVYGQRAASAITTVTREQGATLVGIESFGRSGASVTRAVRALDAKGAYDAVLIADGGSAAITVAPYLRRGKSGLAQFLGTELWNTESSLANSPAMRGAWFASVSDTLYRQFADKYRARFGGLPYRISSLGYDAILLTVRIAQDWQPRTPFPAAKLVDPGGFIGIDGAFRFRTDGTVERAMEVQEVRAGSFAIVDPAPAKF